VAMRCPGLIGRIATLPGINCPLPSVLGFQCPPVGTAACPRQIGRVATLPGINCPFRSVLGFECGPFSFEACPV
jgi:hypothetical protein